jgi:DNA polymerase III delta subunit
MSGVFDLTRAVEQRDAATALVTLDRLLLSEEPMLLLTLLARELRRAWTVREWTRRGQSPEQIARMLRVPPRVAETLVARARSAAGERLPRQLERCWHVERRLKSGGEPRAELVALVTELCAGG